MSTPEETNQPAPTEPVAQDLGDPTRFLNELEASLDNPVDKPEPVTEGKTKPENEDRPVEGAKRENIKQTTTIEKDPYKEGSNTRRPEILTTPSAPFTETMARLNSISEEEVKGRPQFANWAAVLQSGIARMSYGASADDIFARESAHWVQHLNYGNIKLGQTGVGASYKEGDILVGEQAIVAAQRHVGIGGNFTTPLPHSGFWLTMKPPMEETILELHRQINQIKTEVGRKSYGVLLGSESGLLSELVVRFALTSMTRNSVKDIDNILEDLSIHDINILIWGYLCTIYPNGFNHRAACIADNTKCQHVVQDIINVRHLFFSDKTMFSESMLQHLSSTASGSMPLASVKKYREEMRKNEIRRIIINEGQDDQIEMDLRVPSAKSYFDSTHRWIDTISDKVIEALGADSSYNDRNTLINEHVAMTSMRKYAHWVERIHIGGAIVDREKSGEEQIEKTLDAFSSSVSLREDFFEQVNKYIKDTCAALIGIPDFKCPNCGNMQITDEETLPLHRSIVGIDVVLTFFTVLVQRAQLIRE